MANSPREQFQETLKRFDNAMLVTKTLEGQLRARPMAVAQCESDGDLWFVTDDESGKTDEIARDPNVAVVFQSGAHFLSLTGTATLCRDRDKVEALWNEAWRVWFPEGVDDKNLVLVNVTTTDGEYWDVSGLKGLQYLFDAGKAYLKGEQPAVGEQQHGHVSL